MTVKELINFLHGKDEDLPVYIMQEHIVHGEEIQFSSELRDHALAVSDEKPKYVVLIGKELM